MRAAAASPSPNTIEIVFTNVSIDVIIDILIDVLIDVLIDALNSQKVSEPLKGRSTQALLNS